MAVLVMENTKDAHALLYVPHQTLTNSSLYKIMAHGIYHSHMLFGPVLALTGLIQNVLIKNMVAVKKAVQVSQL